MSKEQKELIQELGLRAKADKNACSELICIYTTKIQAMVVPLAQSADEVGDLSQEGLMGLIYAVRTYDSRKGALFSTYANVCIKNKILTAIRKRPLAAAEITDDIRDTGECSDPEAKVIEKETGRELYELYGSVLTESERRVFEKYLQGEAYNQIALELNISLKAVDNAMQRVRRKLKSILKTD